MTLKTVARQAPLSMGFSRQEYWSRLPPSGDPDPGIEPASLVSSALASGFFTTSATWEALTTTKYVHLSQMVSIPPSKHIWNVPFLSCSGLEEVRGDAGLGCWQAPTVQARADDVLGQGCGLGEEGTDSRSILEVDLVWRSDHGGQEVSRVLYLSLNFLASP